MNSLLLPNGPAMKSLLTEAQRQLNFANMAVGRDDKDAALSIISKVADLHARMSFALMDGKSETE